MKKLISKGDKKMLNGDDVSEMVNDAGLSDNQILKILSRIRNTFPELKLITPNLRKSLRKRKLIFADNFETVETKYTLKLIM